MGAEQGFLYLFFLERVCAFHRVLECGLYSFSLPEKQIVYPSYLCHTLAPFVGPGLLDPGLYPWLFPEQWELQYR